MNMADKIIEEIRNNPDMSISKLSMKLGEPRGKVAPICSLLCQTGHIEIVKISNAKVLRPIYKKEVVSE